jgi:hypothetical protein
LSGPTGAGLSGAAGPVGPTGASGPTGSPGGTTLTVTAAGGIYLIDGVNNPVLNFIRGNRYILNINASGHPFYFQTSGTSYSAGDVYSTGVTLLSGTRDIGTIVFEVPYSAPSTLTYVCQIHANMGNSVAISNFGPSGPQGPSGPSGPAGPSGATGASGTAGVAVAYSNGTDTANLNKIFYNTTGTPPSGTAAGDIYIYY